MGFRTLKYRSSKQLKPVVIVIQSPSTALSVVVRTPWCLFTHRGVSDDLQSCVKFDDAQRMVIFHEPGPIVFKNLHLRLHLSSTPFSSTSTFHRKHFQRKGTSDKMTREDTVDFEGDDDVWCRSCGQRMVLITDAGNQRNRRNRPASITRYIYLDLYAYSDIGPFR